MLLIKFIQNDQHSSLSTCRYQHIVWLPLAELFLRKVNATTKRLKGKAY